MQVEWDVFEAETKCSVWRSKWAPRVTCEKPVDHTGEHAGRGVKGQWFFWK